MAVGKSRFFNKGGNYDPQSVEVSFETFEIVRQDDSGPDEPYVWTFFVKLDGSAIDLVHPQNSKIEVYSPAGSHGDLNLPGGEMRRTDPPRSIPKAVGYWKTTLEQGSLLNLIIPQMAVGAVIIGWEEDIFPSTAAMEEAREAIRVELGDQLTNLLRSTVENCLADPAHCGSDIDFESEISVDRLKAVILNILKDKLAGFVAGAVLANPLFAVVADHDEFIGYGIAGPFFLPEILGAAGFRKDFLLDLKDGEKDAPGFYRVRGHMSRLQPRMWSQPAAVQTDAKVKVIARDPVVDMFYQAELGGGEISSFRRIGEAKFKSGPAAVLSSDGKLMHVFGLGVDDRFWRTFSDDGGRNWQLAWKQIPNVPFTSPPGVAMSGDGKFVKVLGRREDDKIWMSRSIDGGHEWTTWEPVGDRQFKSALLPAVRQMASVSMSLPPAQTTAFTAHCQSMAARAGGTPGRKFTRALSNPRRRRFAATMENMSASLLVVATGSFFGCHRMKDLVNGAAGSGWRAAVSSPARRLR